MGEVTKLSVSNTDTEHLDNDEEYIKAWELVVSLSFPMVLKTAIELDVFGVIARAGPGRQLSAAEIVAQLPTGSVKNPDAATMVDRLLRVLASSSVLTCSMVEVEVEDGNGSNVERKYGLAPAAKYFVPDEDGSSLAGLTLLLQDHVFVGSWSKLTEAVLEGGVPFNKVYGMNAFEYPSVDQRFNEVFNKAMVSQSTYIIKKILEKYKGFEQIQQLVDVGGGLGHTLRVITSKYPSIEGINFDLPHVIENAPPIPGVEHVVGDMFESVPKGDAIFMKWILHDWSDDQCLTLLKNCYKALPNNGKVIVVEAIIPDEQETSAYARLINQMDILMMTQYSGGKERTRKEFEALAKAAGFAMVKDDCYVSAFWVMEFYK